jgi:hypothetical protein
MRGCNPLVVALLCVSACSSEVDAPTATARPVTVAEPIEAEGCYVCCFESNSFTAYRNIPSSWNHHDLPEQWQVVAKPPAFGTQLDALAKQAGADLFAFEVAVKIRGTLGPVGSYGHNGVSRRQLTITDFSDMRAPEHPRCLIEFREVEPDPGVTEDSAVQLPNPSLERP